jgi:hypothetical protein
LARGALGLANTADWIEAFTFRAINTLAAAANPSLAGIDASAVAAFLAGKVADIRAIAVPALLTFGAFPLNAAFCPADRARVFTLILTADVGARLTSTVAGATNAHLASVAVIGTIGVETCAVGQAPAARGAIVDAGAGLGIAVLTVARASRDAPATSYAARIASLARTTRILASPGFFVAALAACTEVDATALFATGWRACLARLTCADARSGRRVALLAREQTAGYADALDAGAARTADVVA